jgi:hypothetical protein
MQYRKKPVVVEAWLLTKENKQQVFNNIRCNCAPDWDEDGNECIKIQTLEGIMTAKIGDYVIKGVAGEFYPCRADIFEATYEKVEVE